MTILGNMNTAQKAEFDAAVGATAQLVALDARVSSGQGVTASALAGQAALRQDKLRNPRRIAVLSDSILAKNNATLNGYGYALTPYDGPPFTSVIKRASSVMAFFQVLSGNQFQYDYTLCKGIPGDNLPAMADRFDADIAPLNASILILEGGTNPIGTNYSAGPNIAATKSILKKALALGMQVFLCSLTPRGTWPDSPTASVQDQRRRNMLQQNAWREAAAKRLPGVTYVDFWGPWAVQSGVDANPVAASVQADTLHPSNNQGAFALGKALWEAFQSVGYRYPTPSRNYNLAASRSYDAVENPFANRTTNSALVGTAGTVQANVTGTMADNWLAQWYDRLTGVAVGSQVARRDGLGQCQQFVLTAPSGQINEVFQITKAPQYFLCDTTGTMAASFRIAVEVLNAVGFRGFQIYIRYRTGIDGTGTVLQDGGLFYNAAGPLPETAWYGLMETEPLTVPVGAQSVEVFIRITLDGTIANSTATIKLYDAFYGNVPSDADVFS